MDSRIQLDNVIHTYFPIIGGCRVLKLNQERYIFTREKPFQTLETLLRSLKFASKRLFLCKYIKLLLFI